MAKPKRPSLAGIGMRLLEGSLARKKDHPVRQIVADEGLLHLPVTMLRPNPDQPRKYFDENSLRDLTASIKERGVLQPVIARKDPEGEDYILIAGERRWRAATAAGLSTIPALVRGEEDALEVAIIENLQRENLNALEEAEALLRLKKVRGFTDAQLAQVVGKSRSSVTESLSLTKLPEPIKADCRALDIGSKIQLLTVLRAGPEPKMLAAWDAVKSGEASTTRKLKARTRDPKGRPENYRFSFRPEAGAFTVSVHFSKREASAKEVKKALLEAIASLDGDA